MNDSPASQYPAIPPDDPERHLSVARPDTTPPAGTP